MHRANNSGDALRPSDLSSVRTDVPSVLPGGDTAAVLFGRRNAPRLLCGSARARAARLVGCEEPGPRGVVVPIIVDQKYDPPNKNSSILYVTSTNNAACKDEY